MPLRLGFNTGTVNSGFEFWGLSLCLSLSLILSLNVSLCIFACLFSSPSVNCFRISFYILIPYIYIYAYVYYLFNYKLFMTKHHVRHAIKRSGPLY